MCSDPLQVAQQKQVLSPTELDRLLQQLVRQAWVVRDLYGLGLTQDKLHTEMRSFLPHIHNWLNKYMASASITGVRGVGRGGQAVEKMTFTKKC